MPANLTLECTAYTASQLPPLHEAQIALAGRSNVGKSSLLNALAGRRQLAKVSATPGKTRSVNFYRVAPHRFYLVDLPGYGYAKASHGEREQWARLLDRYLAHNTGLRALALLLDCRLPPQGPDKSLLAFARDLGTPLLPVLTKADKCGQRERAARRREWKILAGTPPLLTSARSREGLPELWACLVEVAAGARAGRQGQASAGMPLPEPDQPDLTRESGAQYL